jgi:Dynein, heavy chain
MSNNLLCFNTLFLDITKLFEHCQLSVNLLSIYLDKYVEIPWDALKYLIAGVIYGGHVTDDWDRRLLTTYVNQYFCEATLQISLYRYISKLYWSMVGR